MNNQSIGILDSGVGGLTIWKEIIKQLPNESINYVADSANCPYGNKSSNEIYNLAKNLVEFLISKKVKLIVIACNTITVSCLDKLRLDFPKIPLIGAVPVVKTAVEKTRNGRIGILSTKATSQSKYQKALIGKFANGFKVKNIGTDKLVPLVEKGEVENIDFLLKEELKPFIKENIDVLVLGCTHFPFLKDKIEGILGEKVLVLDSGPAISRQVRRVLEANNILSQDNPLHNLFTTGNIKVFNRITKKLLGKEALKMVKLWEIL